MFTIKAELIESSSKTNIGHFQQTPFWAEFKTLHGWQSLRFSVNTELINSDSAPLPKEDFVYQNTELSVLTRAFGKGFFKFSIAYIPLAPGLLYKNHSAEEQTIEIASFIYELSKSIKSFLPKNTIAIRFDPAIDFFSPEERDNFVKGLKIVSFADKIKLKKTKTDIQPPDSTQIMLSGTEEEILSNMKSKWRYNIHLSERKGVQIQKINVVESSEKEIEDAVNIFYDLYKITSERDGIALHAKSYYKDLILKSKTDFTNKKDSPLISMYIAKHEEDFLGAIITLFSKTESIYLYGCSSNVKRNLMPNFLLQWTAIKDAKNYGSSYYDMYGMPPTDDSSHPMHGLYLFKTGFGGKNIHRPGTYDVPTSSIYGLYTFLENLRGFWHKKVKKALRGR